jgi:acetoin utilization protein AcuB
MRRSLITVSPSDTLHHAMKTLESWRIRHLPVVEGDRIVGIISDRDVKRAAPSPFDQTGASEFVRVTAGLSVKEVMARDVVTISQFAPIEEAAALMLQRRIGALPVAANGRLVGIITETDVLGTMTEMMGATQIASRVEVEIPASPGMLAEVIRIVEGERVEIASLVTLAAHEGARLRLIMRLRTINADPVVRALTERGYPQVVSEFVK